jgi:AcrR family transcriptional regulator
MTPKTGTRREQIKAETKRLILDAAYELFDQKGYAKTTMRELAAKAGVGLGTIFQHFPDKSALLLSAFTEDLNQIAIQAYDTMPQTTMRDQCEHLVSRIFEFYASKPQLARELLREGLFSGHQATRRLMDQEKALSQQMVLLYEQAVKRGELREGLDLPLVASGFWAIYFFVLINGLRTGRFSAPELTAQLMALYDQLVLGIGAPGVAD